LNICNYLRQQIKNQLWYRLDGCYYPAIANTFPLAVSLLYVISTF
jgi:hypothetical protein